MGIYRKQCMHVVFIIAIVPIISKLINRLMTLNLDIYQNYLLITKFSDAHTAVAASKISSATQTTFRRPTKVS